MVSSVLPYNIISSVSPFSVLLAHRFSDSASSMHKNLHKAEAWLYKNQNTTFHRIKTTAWDLPFLHSPLSNCSEQKYTKVKPGKLYCTDWEGDDLNISMKFPADRSLLLLILSCVLSTITITKLYIMLLFGLDIDFAIRVVCLLACLF